MDLDTSANLEYIAEICRRTMAVRVTGPLESLDLDDRGMHVLGRWFLTLYENFDPGDRDQLRMFSIVALTCVDTLRILRRIEHRNTGEEGLYRLCMAYLVLFRHRGTEVEGPFAPANRCLH
jgi:hypothetical protein